MPINEEESYIFVHIDKTAGSSIVTALNKDVPTLNNNEPVWFKGKHDDINKLVRVAKKKPEEYFKFAIVRNPYDRCLSKYFHHIKTHAGLPAEKRAKDLSFSDWVAQGGLNYFRPQIHYLIDSNGKLCIDFVGRFEFLDRDFKTICKKLGKDTLELGHVNFNHAITDRKHYSHYYDDKTREYIYNRYKIDFDILGYTFERQSEQSEQS